ncbi:alpha/beta hydrolase-fold protein [Lacinutrix jangbogonensis]|uniref:alpha/beta hydrolase-fold protein n=1 Tax=Lacinutrix jangbogonensis TaxID=1469557 RepID=UPI00053EF1A1|nr:alpha/beta hydrolase-fold protein [Lacinutrix jangbogonensis]
MRIVISIIFIIFCHFTTDAQETEFVHRSGILDSLYSKTLNENRSIYIQVPESYQSNSTRKYPVAYIIDGEVFMPALSNVLEYYSGGFMPEMVLVGISNSENRTRDLTISKVTSRQGMPFNQENGEADNFLKFISEELIPYVERNYPVTRYRTLIGHSYGGLFAIYSLIHEPQLFANYLSIDPSLDWDNQTLLKQAEETLANNNLDGKALYMSLSGQLHWQDSKITIDNVMQDTSDFTVFARSNIAFSNMISENKQSKLFYKWQFYPNDLHGTIPLPSIKDGLLALFEWYQMENTDQINAFDTTRDELLNIITHREHKLRNHFGYTEPPYSEELLNTCGYMNMEMNKTEKAKMYFELAIKYFPNSANTYDSLSEYYESQKDYDNAIKLVAKAFEISKSEFHKNRMESLKAKKL